MPSAPQWYFDAFRLDLDSGCLWRDTEMIPLRPKTFAVLVSLVERAGQLATKQELLDAVWPQTCVGDAVLKACLHEIRQALGDTAKSQQYIRTVHRRGYRFTAPVTAVDALEPVAAAEVSPSQGGAAPPMARTDILVDRETVLDELQTCLERARHGERQVVFITGEAGIGKTAVIEAFMRAQPAAIALVLGQCIEKHGLGEAYGPVLEMLGQLCRSDTSTDGRDERIIDVLRQHAPTWLVQMPWLLEDNDREILQRELLGATRERMLRELPEALEVIALDTPLIVILEDLHWSDYATLDLIAVLARRRERMRLLLIATYRPVEVILQNHPLREVKQDLVLRGQGTEIALELLDEKAVRAYLNRRFPGCEGPDALTRLLYRRTDGNPLFLVNLTESLVSQGFVVNREGRWGVEGGLDTVEMALPDTLRQMIEQQLRRLEPEALRIVETASVAGVTFTAASVAAAMAYDVEAVEEWCEQLVHH